MASRASSPDDNTRPPEAGCSNPDRRPTKRRRIAVACGSCRNRKSRCDGIRPKCNTCRDLNLECIYAQGDPTLKSEHVTVTRRYLDVVETRLSTLESTVKQLTSRLDQHKESSSDTAVTNPAIQGDDSCSSNTLVVSDPTDGMGSIIYTDEEDAGYFGPSSNITFTRHITRAISAVLGSANSPVPSTTNSGPVMLEISRPQSSNADLDFETKDAFTLPPHEEMEMLIARYFGDTGMLYPYIHERSFMETYYKMKSMGVLAIRRSWLALLNMILAQATTTSVEREYDAKERISKSEIFYKRAMTLCRHQIVRCASVELGIVKVPSQRFCSKLTSHGSASFARDGAISARCPEIYENVEHPWSGSEGRSSAWTPFTDGPQTLSPLEKEIRTRVWYGCVMLDRTLSMTFGRPPAIPEYYVCTSPPVGYPPSDGDRASEHGSLLFYNSTIGLYKILWATLETLYGYNLGRKQNDNVFELASRIFQIENQLLEWKGGLDPSLQLITLTELFADDSYSDAKKFRIILTLRYHNLRLLAHRPVLDAHLCSIGRPIDDRSQHSMLQQLGPNSLTICTESARTIIDIVHDLVHSTGPKRRLLGAWWFSLYYTFNSALAIFAVLLIDSRTSPGSGVSWKPTLEAQKSSLERGLQTLQWLDQGNKMTEKCARFTTTLTQMINVINDGRQAGSSLTLPGCNALGEEMPHDGASGSQMAHGLLADFASDQPTVGLGPHDFGIVSEMDFLNEFSARGLFY